MELIDEIRNHASLNPFICPDCTENGVGFNFSPEVNKGSYIIIKVDEYYSSLKLKAPPPSPDCLIIQHCKDNKYVIFVVELKNIDNMKTISLNNLREKFVTCLKDFMSDTFRDIFYNEAYDFTTSLNLLFISAPAQARTNDKSRTTRLDNFLSMPPCEFANKKYIIKHKIPNPVLNPCIDI